MSLRTPTLVVFLFCLFRLASAQSSIATVSTATTVHNAPRSLLGVTFDARSGMNGNSAPLGYFTSTGATQPGMDAIWSAFPLSTLRYPGNAIAIGFQWKLSIGAAPRQNQNLLGPLGPSQPVDFGFDEWMDMVLAKGVDAADVQIMAPIYDAAITYATTAMNNQRVPSPAVNVADWVEYCNAPAGVNWAGGHAWGDDRVANGRYLPYGIKLWNMGNEPWADNEYDNTALGAQAYLAAVEPIIDSMLARDPSIHITLPVVGGANSPWNIQIKAYANAHGGIYGVSPHFFPQEDSTSYGVIPIGLNTVGNTLAPLAANMAANNLKTIVGDFGHDIPTNAGFPIGDPELANQWKGGHLCAELILLMSQIANIERANLWIHGMPVLVWNPVRYNGPGSYTALSTTQLYTFLFPLLLDRSKATSTTSPVGTDGNPYSVRTSAFSSNDGSLVNVIAVNRDPSATHTLRIDGLPGFVRDQARILTAAAPTSDNFTVGAVAPNGSGHFTLPPKSVLVVEYSSGVVNVSARALLDGCFDANTQLMRDDLRTSALIPLNEPYSAMGFTQVNNTAESLIAARLNTAGNNAVVDWVRLELRAALMPSVIVATRQALLQRDGDIVDVDGVSPVHLHAAPGNYHLAVRHRNHLGTMTAAPMALSGLSTLIDLSDPSVPVHGSNARKSIGNKALLWAGNTLVDGSTSMLKYTGAGNDRDPILVAIGGTVPTNAVSGYRVEDVSMDGITKYTGSGNDRDPILVNIGGTVPTSTLTEQLP